MLEMTTAAGTAVREMLDAEGVASAGGLRLLPRAASATSSSDDPGAETPVEVEVTAASSENDQVVGNGGSGARVFLDSLAAEVLDATVLDARRTIQGRVNFVLRPQQE
jgi:Fe-S cluster assembly iron-binding protein IscA